MSCKPLSWLFVNVDRYLYSFVSASSVFGFDLGDCVCAVASMLVKTEEASSGIGSSGLVECER